MASFHHFTATVDEALVVEDRRTGAPAGAHRRERRGTGRG
jgi:hypothetical protein